MQRKWSYLPLPSANEVADFQGFLSASHLTLTLLLQRNIKDLEAAKAFFNPSLADLHDPFLMQGMSKAVQKIIQAIRQKKHIRIYGDYDVDGTTSVALFCKVLKQLYGNVSYYIPDRYQEGYGVSEQGISQAIRDEVGLLICVDCGTRDIEQLGRAKSGNIDVIICDHHEPGNHLPPAVAILNPKQKACNYPFRELSGCGIVFKLLQGLLQRTHNSSLDLYSYLDLVVLSIAADIVPMVGENRILAHHGLITINQSKRPGINALKALSYPKQNLNIKDIVFRIAPYINAAGRVNHASIAVELLMAQTQDKAKKIATILEQNNTKRKAMDEELLKEALHMIESEQTNRLTTVLYKDTWSKGVVGIGAARCVENCYRPTILLTKENEQLVGSARSVVGYNIYEALKKCQKWLTKYGGHAYAAGLSLPYQHFSSFRADFEEVVRKTWRVSTRVASQVIDVKLNFRDLTKVFCKTIDRMRPFGPDNQQPVFSTEPVIAIDYKLYQNKHLMLLLKDGTSSQLWKAIGFNMGGYLPLVQKRNKLTIAYQVENNTYQGLLSKQLIIKDIKPYT